MAEIFPSAQVDCNPPLNLSGNSDADLFVHSPIPHLYKSTHIAGRVSLAVLSDIRMLTPHGLLFDSGGNLIAESYHNSKMVQIVLREVQTMLSDGLVNTEPTKTIKTPAMLLMGPWSWVYHHWILENLPRLWAVDEFPELGKVPLVVPGDITEFQEASLKALGIGSNQVIPFDGSNWRFKRLFVPSFLAPSGHSHRQVQWLRNKLFEGLGIIPNSTGSQRIYISRVDATSRRIINEDEVVALLNTYNFETIVPGTLSIRDQVNIFNNASIICGAGGSGLTNHVFAPKGITLIEIQPDSFINRCYYYSSNICGQDYAFVIGRNETDRHDYRIEIESLEKTLTQVLAN